MNFETGICIALNQPNFHVLVNKKIQSKKLKIESIFI